LKGEANVLIMPNLDAANIAYTMTMIMADTLPVGPILIGTAKPAHILTPSVTVRGIINMTAVCVAQAQGDTCAGAPGEAIAASAVPSVRPRGKAL
jgi:malate dehydrogenase (oxaloacetate-decarboxylating)(NADP+)